MNLIIFILACYGMTMILVYGKIFNSIRPKYHMFHCTMCMGFWVGILVNLLMFKEKINIFNNLLTGSFLSGCISSGTSYLLSRIIDDEGFNIKIKKDF